MGKRKKIKPDDYYNNGHFELARFGRVVSMRNNMTQEQQKLYIDYLAEHYQEVKDKITCKINKIKDLVSTSNPLSIMNFFVSMSFVSMANMLSENEYTAEQNYTIRAIEYIQSILVSTENYSQVGTDEVEDDSEKYFEILNLVIELYQEVNMFYSYWGAYIKKQEESISDEIIRYIVESQLAALVRGERYQIYEIAHLRSLLLPHDDVMIELFQITGDEFITGLEKLQYALSSAKADAANNFMEAFEKIQKKFDVNEEASFESLIDDKEREKAQFAIEDLFGNSLYNVKRVTQWSDEIIDSLSYELNQYDDFFDGEYAGWPIKDLPVQKKPFIKIDGVSYCFDYYNLFDNIYRIIQKTIKELKPSYVNDWSHIQQRTSEQMVEKLFKKLLPGSLTFRDNYYPKNKSLKQCDENDVIVIYNDILIVIEVKAGSFTYTPAITDYQAHINSFKALVEKADYQCERIINYIRSNKESAIYDNDKNLKIILKQDDFKEIYSFCVTVDNFNEFAAKAEKLSFIKLQSGAIAISIDDLRVYSDYFESPMYFLHYLKQRKLATKIENLNLNDELDHLGMYIKHNVYSITMSEFDKKSIVNFNGYREDIDNYFMSLFTDKITFPKPMQKIPDKIKEIIEFLEKNDIVNKIYLSNFLLDFAADAKEQLNDAIEHILVRQKEIKTMIPMITFGEIRYCLFVNQPDVPDLGDKYKSDYVDASILYKKLDDYVLIDLFYDKEKSLEEVKFSIHSLSNIPESRYEELNKLGEKYAQSRMQTYQMKTGKKKLGRNDLCPCGSRRKYKKCCEKLGF